MAASPYERRRVRSDGTGVGAQGITCDAGVDGRRRSRLATWFPARQPAVPTVVDSWFFARSKMLKRLGHGEQVKVSLGSCPQGSSTRMWHFSLWHSGCMLRDVTRRDVTVPTTNHVAAPPRPKVNIQVPLWAGHVSVPASCPRDSRSPHRCLWLRDAYPRDGLIVFSTYTAIFAPPLSQLASVPNTMPLVSVSRLVPSFLRGNSRRKSHTCDDNAKFGLYNALHGRVNRSYASLSSFDTSTTSSGTTRSTHSSIAAVHAAPITDDLVEQMEDARLLRAVDPRSHLAVQIQAMEYLYRMFWDGYYDVDPPDAIQCLSEGPEGTAGAEGAEECQGAERGTGDEGAEECRGAERRGSIWLLHKGTQTTPAIILSAAEYDFASPAYNNIWWDMNHECLVAPYGQRRSHRKVRQCAKPVVDGTTLMQLDGADRWMATVCARIVQPVAAPPVVAPPVTVPAKRRSVKNKLKKLFK